MIKPQELRLGNWVVFTNSMNAEMYLQMDVFLLAYMTEANPDYVQHGYGIQYRKRSIRGIPLTQELLEKCGLERKGHISWRYPGNTHTLYFEFKFYPGNSDAPQLQLYAGIDAWDYAYGKKIKYLHELQNLLFSLTGEELQIELERKPVKAGSLAPLK